MKKLNEIITILMIPVIIIVFAFFIRGVIIFKWFTGGKNGKI